MIEDVESAPAPAPPSKVHGVFRAALNGVHERGDGGFVFVKGDSCAYMFPRELQGQPALAETLTELLEDREKADRVFYVVNQTETQLHLVAYPRDRVLQDLMTPYQTRE